MTLNQQELREYLDQLTNAVESMSVSDEDKIRLSSLINDIENQLSGPVPGSDNSSLVEQVEGMVSTFENDHPTVTGILNNIILSLSSMGV